MTTERSSTVLRMQLLDELGESLRRRSAPIVSNLRPGLAAEEIDRLTGPLGLRLPDEARVWWSWHDGANLDRPRIECLIGPLWIFPPLSFAVEMYRQTEQVAQDPDILDDWWTRNGSRCSQATSSWSATARLLLDDRPR